MGFIIAGTTQDGTYLGVRDRGWCNNTTALNDAAFSTAPGKCAGGRLGIFENFSLATASSSDANIPRDPLFYAAKWGGPGVNGHERGSDRNCCRRQRFCAGYFYVSDPSEAAGSIDGCVW